MKSLFKQLASEALDKVHQKVVDNCDPYGAYSATATFEIGKVEEDFVLEKYTATADHNCGAETTVVVRDEAGAIVYSEEY